MWGWQTFMARTEHGTPWAENPATSKTETRIRITWHTRRSPWFFKNAKLFFAGKIGFSCGNMMFFKNLEVMVSFGPQRMAPQNVVNTCVTCTPVLTSNIWQIETEKLDDAGCSTAPNIPKYPNSWPILTSHHPALSSRPGARPHPKKMFSSRRCPTWVAPGNCEKCETWTQVTKVRPYDLQGKIKDHMSIINAG